MKLVLRIVLAIIAGAILTGVLDYFHLLTHIINVLLGIATAIVVFLSWDGEVRH